VPWSFISLQVLICAATAPAASNDSNSRQSTFGFGLKRACVLDIAPYLKSALSVTIRCSIVVHCALTEGLSPEKSELRSPLEVLAQGQFLRLVGRADVPAVHLRRSGEKMLVLQAAHNLPVFEK
jgi:hypothetical protein